MREYDSLVLDAKSLPSSVVVGQEFDVRVRGRVRRIEADHIDVSGYGRRGGTAVLEGDIRVELTVVSVWAEPAYLRCSEEDAC